MIRELHSPDIQEVYELCREVHTHYSFPMGTLWKLSVFESILLNGVCLGYFQDGKLISLMLCSINSEALDVELFVTASHLQKQGVGSQLFSNFLSKVPENKEVWLEVHEQNTPAIGFYKKQGFQIVGERPNYYPGGHKAILMTFRLPKALS